MRNRHSADQLAEVRKDLEDLKAKKKFLRTLLLETRDFRERSGEPTRRSAPSRGWIALPQSSGGELLETRKP